MSKIKYIPEPWYPHNSHNVLGLKTFIDPKTRDIIVEPGGVEYFIDKKSEYYPKPLFYELSKNLNLGKVGDIPENFTVYIIARVYYKKKKVRTVKTKSYIHNTVDDFVTRRDIYYYDVLLASIFAIGEIGKNRTLFLTDFVTI